MTIHLVRARYMLLIVAIGLLLSGISVWPIEWEVETAIRVTGDDGEIGKFLVLALQGVRETKAKYPFLLYALDWLGFAHIVLAILFFGVMRDPARNVWVVQCGLIACLGVVIVAAVCIPIRGLPPAWFWIDFAFAPAAAAPLWVALRDIRSQIVEGR